MDTDNSLLQRYSPCLVFHPAEKYFPVDLSLLYETGALQNGTLIFRNECNSRNVDANTPLYGNVTRVDGKCYLDYWAAYTFNGDQGCKLKSGIFKSADMPFSWHPLANHFGDFENVCVQVDEESGDVLDIYASAHGSLSPVAGSVFKDVQYADRTHPIIFVALNSHANYAQPADVRNDNRTLDTVMPILIPILTFGFYSSFEVCDLLQGKVGANRAVLRNARLVNVAALDRSDPANAWCGVDVWGGKVDQTAISPPPSGTPFRFVLYIVLLIAKFFGATRSFVHKDELGVPSFLGRAEFRDPRLYFVRTD